MRFWMVLAYTFLCVGCATSEEWVLEKRDRQARIQEVLSQPLDETGEVQSKRCISEHEYRSFRPLGDRHILFSGSRDRYWVNTLRASCPELRHGTIIQVKSFSSRRICDTDRFMVSDWFDWPWYRRWPWHWGRTWGSGVSCSFGKFRPATEEQVEEIKAILKPR